MEESWYEVEQRIHDRITEARMVARAQALLRDRAPRHRGRHAVGMALIRLGAWLLASGVQAPIEFSRALANLRAAAARSVRA
jgi:hypothetical protein